MTAANIPLTIEQGATFRGTWTWTFPLLDGDDEVVVPVEPGEPWDFTGCTAKMDVRLKLKDEDPVFSITSEADEITLSDVGVVEVYITADKTNLLGKPNTRVITDAVYDVEVYYPGGDTVRLMEGAITVKPSVTRSDV